MKVRKTDSGDRDLNQYRVTPVSLMEQKRGKNRVRRIPCCQIDLLLTHSEDDDNKILNKVSWIPRHCKTWKFGRIFSSAEFYIVLSQ